MNCIGCGSPQLRELHKLDIGVVHQCVDCTLATLWRLDGSGLVECSYDETYYTAGADSLTRGYADYAGAEAPLREATAKAMVNLAMSHASGVRVLDVGCGGGYFVEAAIERGLDAYGIDPSAAAVKLAHDRVDPLRVHVESPAQHLERVGRARYDLVVMLDVLEHVPDPGATVLTAIELLAPGGVLLIATPRFGGRLYRQNPLGYVQFKVDHLAYFTETALARLVDDTTDIPWRLTLIEHDLIQADPPPPADVLEKYRDRRDTMFMVVGPAGRTTPAGRRYVPPRVATG